jgi:hypothetical protein
MRQRSAESTKERARAAASLRVESPERISWGSEPDSTRRILASVLGGLLIVVVGVAVPVVASHAPHVGISTEVGQGEPFGSPAFLSSDDQVTDKQWQERADAFNAFKAKGAVVLDRADSGQALSYIDKALLDSQQKQALTGQLQGKDAEMVAVGFYDDCTEDGDVIAVRSGPINVYVPLTHQVQYVLVPVPRGGTSEIFVTGIKDGRAGGITLGMVTPRAIVHMPRLTPNQQASFLAS